MSEPRITDDGHGERPTTGNGQQATGNGGDGKLDLMQARMRPGDPNPDRFGITRHDVQPVEGAPEFNRVLNAYTKAYQREIKAFQARFEARRRAAIAAEQAAQATRREFLTIHALADAAEALDEYEGRRDYEMGRMEWGVRIPEREEDDPDGYGDEDETEERQPGEAEAEPQTAGSESEPLG